MEHFSLWMTHNQKVLLWLLTSNRFMSLCVKEPIGQGTQILIMSFGPLLMADMATKNVSSDNK